VTEYEKKVEKLVEGYSKAAYKSLSKPSAFYTWATAQSAQPTTLYLTEEELCPVV